VRDAKEEFDVKQGLDGSGDRGRVEQEAVEDTDLERKR